MTESSRFTLLSSSDPCARLAERLDGAIVYGDRDDLIARLAALAKRLPRQPRTLDLVGMTGADHILQIAGRPLDASIKRVRAFWRELAGNAILDELGITMIRLVGSATAVGTRARATLAALAEITEREVTGTTELVSFADFTRAGFEQADPIAGIVFLDLDLLPREPLRADARVITVAEGRDVLATIDRHAGHALPDLLAVPSTVLALPNGDHFHHLELLLDHDYVRAGELVFPVDDPRRLRQLV